LGEVINNQITPLLIKGVYASFNSDNIYDFGSFEFTSDILKGTDVASKTLSLEILETLDAKQPLVRKVVGKT
jgi:hypothetical protein